MALRDDILAQLSSGPKNFEDLLAAIGGLPEDLNNELDAMELEGLIAIDTDTLLFSMVPVAVDHSTAIGALSDVICSIATCANDVDVVLTTEGNTKIEWDEGQTVIGDLLQLLRCPEIRTKLAAAGADLTNFDAMLDAADLAHLINEAMNNHHGQPGT